MIDMDRIRAVILANKQADRPTFAGLDSDEIAAYHRVLMFGENDEGFPDQDEWSRIVN